MKRLGWLVILMALGSSAHAGELSFVIGGHRIQIDARKSCRSASCVSVAIPGLYLHHLRDRDDVAAPSRPAAMKPPVVTEAAVPAVPASAQRVASPKAVPIVVPVNEPAQQTAAAIPASPSPASPMLELAASATQRVPPPPAPVEPALETGPSKTEPAKTEPLTTVSVEQPPVVTVPIIAAPVAETAPSQTPVVQETESEAADTPLGDWQTEGKTGLVRIERCGSALCGSMLDPVTSVKGETVLINMKPKRASEWSGSIYSRASGNTYYATMAMKQLDRLHVEACAVGAFFCSGNDWTRVAGRLHELITSRGATPPPHS
ncbi:DUF2147 domain-containing protein [Bradyrhizobium sp.]|uniref:DUF2147 domain-containing protein n=1 Tax=Bradyrhizobium sp. TaxID=376 RepID=UPI003C468439